MNTKAHNWFASKDQLIQVCNEAVKKAEGEDAISFTTQMLSKAQLHGINLYMTEKQVRWLCRLAGCGVPLPRT